MGSHAEEEVFISYRRRNSAKPAFMKVLADAETKPETVRTLSDAGRSGYHGYSRWLTRRAKSMTSRELDVFQIK